MAELQHIATFCSSCDCGCPELFIDPSAENDKRVVTTDVFGRRIQMSLVQSEAPVSNIKASKVDEIVPA